MEKRHYGTKKYQCPSCHKFLPADLVHFMKCEGYCNRWICYECLRKNPCDFNSLHSICPDCVNFVRLVHRLPSYIIRCRACAEKYGDIHDRS